MHPRNVVMTMSKYINRSYLFFSTCLTCLAVVMLGSVGIAGATDFYVAKDGRDSNLGTEADPWLSVQKAADNLIAGDTVNVKAGTYNERVVPRNSGSPGNYITYTAYPGDTVTIDGTGITMSSAGLFHIEGKNYIRVSGFNVVNHLGGGGCFGIHILEHCDHIIIENNFINNIGGCGIYAFRAVSNLVIDNNEVCYTNLDPSWGQEMISLFSTDTFVVKNNHVHHSDNNAIKGKRNTSNGEIYNNHVHDCGSGISLDARGYICNYNIHHNIIYDCPGSGIILETQTGGTLENINVYNNISYNNASGFNIQVSHNDDEGSHLKKNITVINNTLHNNNIAIQITDYGENFENLIIRNNILSKDGTWGMINWERIVWENVSIDHNLLTDSSNVYGDDYIIDDPKFVSPDTSDFHLQEDSPAIDNGSAVDTPNDDYDGNFRPQGAGYDIGAYEFIVTEEEPDPAEDGAIDAEVDAEEDAAGDTMEDLPPDAEQDVSADPEDDGRDGSGKEGCGCAIVR